MAELRLYHWLCLVGAVLFEVTGTTLMKAGQGWSMAYGAETGVLLMLVCIGVSYYLLSLATTAVPVGVAFAFWEGAGLALISLSSVFVLGEHMTPVRFAALCAVLAGVLLVHRGTSAGEPAESRDSGSTGDSRGNRGKAS